MSHDQEGNPNAKRAAVALAGGHGPRPEEDGSEAFAIWGACESMCGTSGEDDEYRVFNATAAVIVIGYEGVPGQHSLTSYWEPYKRGGNSGSWSGLRRRPQ